MRLRTSQLLLLLLFAGCSKAGPQAPEKAPTALPPGTAECAACSMVVREQPAPRGQTLYRDGSRKYFCSLADLMQFLRAPSALGAPTQIFVEVLDGAADPRTTSSKARPWVLAKTASFVVGVPRSGVMGKPALAYAERAAAERVAAAHKARVVDFAGLGVALLAAPKGSHAGH